MQKAANIMGVLLTAFMLAGALIYGCGTDDPFMEETNLRYWTDVTFSDHDEDDTIQVDVVRNGDCDEDGNATDPEDPLTDLLAIITIEIPDATTPGIEMTGYEISFQPLQSYDQGGNPVTPPSVGSYQGAYDAIIPSESDVTFTITCMEYDLKDYIGGFLTNTDIVFRYRVRIKMDFIDDFNEEREITVERTLYFGAFNTC
jgi:hypothetical protein